MLKRITLLKTQKKELRLVKGGIFLLEGTPSLFFWLRKSSETLERCRPCISGMHHVHALRVDVRRASTQQEKAFPLGSTRMLQGYFIHMTARANCF